MITREEILATQDHQLKHCINFYFIPISYSFINFFYFTRTCNFIFGILEIGLNICVLCLERVEI